jgi:DNA invertase Pin-like site-specific DNA recombinase
MPHSRRLPNPKSKPKRVALYVRVSTADQTTASQKRELAAWAKRAGHQLVRVYEDQGISGAKGRDGRPQFDALLKAAVRREFDVIAVWSSDRLGRSLPHLIEVLQTIRDTGTGLYIQTQAVDTTTPSGRAMFGMLSVFAEFEREMIRERVQAGLNRVKAEIDRDGRFTSRKGVVRRRLGRPGAEPEKIELARIELARGTGIGKTARLTGLGVGTVAKLKGQTTASAIDDARRP